MKNYSVFSIFLLALLVISCGPPPQSGMFPSIAEVPASAEKSKSGTQSMTSQANLPSGGRADLRKMPYVRNVFKEVGPVRRGAINDLYATTRGKVDNIAIVSNSSLDVLKAFIAHGWAPIVVIQFQGRNLEMLPVVRYNHVSSDIFLQNPNNFAERRVSDEDFETYWGTGSRNQCALITPQQLTEARVRAVLSKYLPAAAYEGISVRSR